MASASGVVIFAGPVAGTLHVTIRHPDGLRTSYSFLARIAVAVGRHVGQGQLVGVAGPVFHFGVRDPEGDYLDPESLFAGRVGAHLVPGPDDGAAPLGVGNAGERRNLLGVVLDMIDRVGAPVAAMGEEELSLLPSVSAYRLARRARRLPPIAAHVHARVGPRGEAVPSRASPSSWEASAPPMRARRSIGWTRTSLGYARPDVLRFSYAGGRVASRRSPRGALAAIPVTAYRASDTEVDLQESASRLVDLLGQVAGAAPGVPIDVIAHSQGGVVARLALDQGLAEHRLPAQVGLVVTIASPHQGDDAATANQAVTVAQRSSGHRRSRRPRAASASIPTASPRPSCHRSRPWPPSSPGRFPAMSGSCRSGPAAI